MKIIYIVEELRRDWWRFIDDFNTVVSWVMIGGGRWTVEVRRR